MFDILCVIILKSALVAVVCAGASALICLSISTIRNCIKHRKDD